MKLAKIEIENFRAIEHQEIILDNYTCIVGANGSGKSTILNALNLFFRPQTSTVYRSISKHDFFKENTTSPIRVILTFNQLSKDAERDLADYVRHGELVVMTQGYFDGYSVIFKQYGFRKVMPEFKNYFESEKNKAVVAELKEIFRKLREQYSDLPNASTKEAMKEALRAYEESNPEKCQLLESEDEFYGVSSGKDRLGKHLQWVYIPAVKDASQEQDESKGSALGELLSRSIRKNIDFKPQFAAIKEKATSEYKNIIDVHKPELEWLSERLENKLREWSTPKAALKLDWAFDEAKVVNLSEPFATLNVGEGDFLGKVMHMGHGFQRSLIVTLLQELATSPDPENIPTLILGFEEPELYQHPPQAKYMQKLLEKMCNDNTQAIITTHSPYFAPARGFDKIRRVRKDEEDRAIIKSATVDKVTKLLSEALKETLKSESSMLAKLEQIMQPAQSELYFCRVPILVEGVEDVAYLATALELENKMEEFRQHGCHFIVTNGKNQMSRPLAIAHTLEYPAFAIFDCDIKEGMDANNLKTEKRDNSCLARLQKYPDTDTATFLEGKESAFHTNMIMWTPNVGKVVHSEFGDEWNKTAQQMREEHSLTEGVDQKNCILIALTLEKLAAIGRKSTFLSKAVNAIIEHAKNN